MRDDFIVTISPSKPPQLDNRFKSTLESQEVATTLIKSLFLRVNKT